MTGKSIWDPLPPFPLLFVGDFVLLCFSVFSGVVSGFGGVLCVLGLEAWVWVSCRFASVFVFVVVFGSGGWVLSALGSGACWGLGVVLL